MDVEDDNLWNPELRESEEELAKRVTKVWKRPEKEIAVVSHGLILQHILINLLANSDFNPTLTPALCKRFDNCELRSVVILDTSKIGREGWAWLCSDDKAKDVFEQCGHHSIDVATYIYLKSSLVA
ncbi:phosphoglycerate mutase-like protein 1 isoform X2 [Gossypium australe]|uniref:Phosphoglycerate mutase-like protein 1 isoform X2 n=1 Tax=Gossypium australe TaxID=47621 RepID=A0A5B6WY77_9ROSI|nr:phosphoglycerate mutase-like protein 1 isoform X2 [Gossypium australe]